VTDRRLHALARVGVLGMFAAVLVATLVPLGDLRLPLGLPAEAWHAILFAALGASLALAYATSAAARRSPRRLLLMALLAIWLLASATELLQDSVPGRQPQLSDWVADVVGGVMGFLLAGPAIRVILRRWSR
jgi:VanZ family protein